MAKDPFLYTGDYTNEISFPLGGLGTGSIGLAGNGRLIDWEIYNRPSKGSLNGFTHFAIRAEAGGKVLDTRVLQGDLHPPYQGSGSTDFRGVGFGPPATTMAGAPHFKSVDFRGEFPIAQLDFKHARFPGKVRQTAFNPLIPLNDKDSGIPAAFFEFEITNPTRKTIAYTLFGSLANPHLAKNLNRVSKAGGKTLLHLTSTAHRKSATAYGDLTLATDAADVSFQEYWFPGGWFDQLEVYWRDITAGGRLKNRRLTPATARHLNEGMLAAHIRIAPGKTKRVRFVITWNFPNCENYWDPTAADRAKKCCVSAIWKNYYATIWKDSKDSARYALTHWDRLWSQTLTFKNALMASDLPPAALEAVSANLAIMKTATVMRLEDGTLYGWEGLCATAGCCEGSCEHVWNYAQAIPFLFPKLERSMREADYVHNIGPNGEMQFRIKLPLGSGRGDFRACADGQFGGVMKLYRDWKISGDDDWLGKLWPLVRKSIRFAWAKSNRDRWDPDKTGVLWGRQHHTLDVELFGPNAWLTGYYLGALKAGAEMAEHLGDTRSAKEFGELFAKGKAWADEHLFNGRWYHQQIDLNDKSIVDAFTKAACHTGDYWDAEHGEIKYQIGEGIEIDQVIAQWHANLYGLGEVFDLKQVRSSLKWLFKVNFRPTMREHFNACRLYCLNDEGGLVIAHWPDDVYRPYIPIPYAGETQNGYEWAACIHMIQAGLVKEGMTCVEAIRERYDGRKRNPWNEFECGNNYARSMATYSLLNTFSGFAFDMPRGMIGFSPMRTVKGRFRCFWSLDSGWGEFEQTPSSVELRLLSGWLKLKTFRLGKLGRKKVKRITLGGKAIPFEREGSDLQLKRTVRIKEGQALRVKLG